MVVQQEFITGTVLGYINLVHINRIQGAVLLTVGNDVTYSQLLDRACAVCVFLRISS